MASKQIVKLGLKFIKALERYELNNSTKAIITKDKTIVKGKLTGESMKKIFDLNNEYITHCKDPNQGYVIVTRNSAINSSSIN